MLKMYKIGVEIAGINGFSPVARVIVRDLLGMGKHADALTAKMGRLKIAAIGAGAALAGVAIVKGLVDVAKAGDRVVKVQQAMRASGFSRGQVKAGTAEAFQTTQSVPGTTWSGNLGVLKELTLATGSFGQAMKILPAIQREHVALQRLGIHLGGAGIVQMVKFIDLLGGGMKNGHLSAERFAKSFKELAQIEILTHGVVPPSQLLRIAQTGGFAARGVSFGQFITANLASIMELGSRAGAGFGAAAIQLVGGNASVKSIEGMKHYGLIKPGGYTNEYGHFVVKPGALYKYNDLIHKGLAYWAVHDLEPKLRAEGVTSQPALLQALSQIMNSIRGLRYVASLIQTPAQQARDQALGRAALKSHPYAASNKTLAGGFSSFSASVENLWEAAGKPQVALATAGLTDLAGGINRIAAAAHAHPGLIRDIGTGGYAAGAGLLAGGTVTLLGVLAKVVGGAVMGAAGTIAAGVGSIVLGMEIWNKPPKFLAALNHMSPLQGVQALAKWERPYILAAAHAGEKFAGVAMHRLDIGAVHLGELVGKELVLGFRAAEKDVQSWLPSWLGGGSPRAAAVPAGHPSNPMHVVGHVTAHVTNGRDIADGVTKHQAKGLQRNPSGPTGHNLRQGYLPPAFPAPGL